jgi:hypothetical protein
MAKLLEGKKTYIGIAIALLAELARLLDIDLGDPEHIVNSVVVVIGAVVAIYGRAAAKPKGDAQ